MLEVFSNIKHLLTENKAKYTKRGLDKIIEKYSLFAFSSDSDFQNNQSVISTIRQSNIIIFNQHTENKQGENYFIIGIQNTILLIKQSLNTLIQRLFSFNKSATIYFLSNTEDVFNSKISVENLQIKSNQNFQNEISYFNNEFHIILADISIKRICYEVLSCITGYLIQQSYLKIKIKQFLDFTTIFTIDPIRNTNSTEFIDERDYIELRLLGQGSSSSIELIYHIEKEEIFAIKKTNENVELFEREYHNYLNINHPFIPKLIGKTKNQNYLIIQYINGQSLENISKFHFTFKEKIILIFELMIIIQYFHENGFVYRDLKPNNVLIDENKTVFLIDFDRMIKISNLKNDGNHTMDFQTKYIAPEATLGIITYSNDIYSIGQMIYYIMNEKSPEIDSNCIIENKAIQTIYKKCINEKYEERPYIMKLMFGFYAFFYREINNSVLKYYPEVEYFDGIINYDINYMTININEAIEFLSFAGNLNESTALFDLGLFHFDGQYIVPNVNKALDYFISAAKLNDHDAEYFLGIIYVDEKYGHKNINKAIHYFTLSADHNNKDAQYNLGALYYHGTHVNRDINKAIHYFTLAANQNHSMAQCNLGIIYYNNIYVKRDMNKSIYYLNLAANQDNIQAQYNLGVFYSEGKLVAKDLNKAIYYYSKSADQGDLNSQFNLGKIYLNIDINKAIYYLKMAANQNDSEAMFSLGNIYNNAEYIKRDINKAIYYFELAANHNHKEAQYLLGSMYYKDRDIKRNINKSIYYLFLAAKNNHIESQFLLGIIYFENKFIEKDINKAIYYISLAANGNHKQAQFFLASVYFLGKYVEKNINKSIHYLFLAAKNNHSDAQFALGFMKINGYNFKQDTNEGIHYITLAANQNNIHAQLYLAHIYKQGYKIPRDINKSIHYFTLAANQNNKEAQFYLGIIYSSFEENIDFKQDIQKSIYYFTLSANQKYSKALYFLGILYLENRFISRDINKSIHYLKLAADQNNSDAQYKLGVILLEGKFIDIDAKKAVYYLTIAANQNHSLARNYLSLCYIFGTGVDKNMNKGIDLLIQSSSKDDIYSNFAVGFFYHEGKNLERNIKKAIHYYKEASSFNLRFAKNNLGIIYKNGFENEIPKNIELAIEYFDEAINQKSDEISMYNLSHIYIYEDKTNEKIDKAIELLIKSSNKSFLPSDILLCIALIKKHGNDLLKIKKEIDDKEIGSFFLSNTIIQMINNYKLCNKKEFEQIYDYYKSIDYIYNFFFEVFPSNQLMIHETIKDSMQTTKNITKEFYDGMSIDF